MGFQTSGNRADGPPAREELQEFLEIRRYVKRIQGGTPLLLRSSDDGGQGRLFICTFKVSQDLKTIQWQEQDGGAEKGEVPVSDVVDIRVREGAENLDVDDDQFVLTLVLAKSPERTKQAITLICASKEDFLSWSDGLRFLIDSQPSLAGASSGGSASPQTSSGTRNNSNQNSAPRKVEAQKAAASSDKGNAQNAELMQTLQQQNVLIAKLKEENRLLQEIIMRKDGIIAELMAEQRNRDSEPSNKTQSSSRESDDHLKDRDRIILERKNKRLKAELQAKKHTINDLLKTLSRLNAQSAAESSAMEELQHDDDDQDSSDGAPPAKVDLQAAAPVARRHKPKQVRVSTAKPEVASQAAPEADEEVDGGQDSPEIEALASKLASLEKALDGLDQRFVPPERIHTPSKSADTSVNKSTSPATASVQEARTASAATPASDEQMVPNARAAGAIKAVAQAKGDFGFGVPTSGLSAASIAALEAVQREMEALEVKKRVVNDLARTLGPNSDNEEEDDGFPLR